MKPGITAYIKDIVRDLHIGNTLANEIKRQVTDIFSGVSEPVFSSSDKNGITVIVGSPDIDIKGLKYFVKILRNYIPCIPGTITGMFLIEPDCSVSVHILRTQ